MIEKSDAERIAAAINQLRPDWPTKSLITLIAELRHWPLRDLAIKLTWVALDQNPDGTYVSQTPARVKENGPWQHLTAIDMDAARERAVKDADERKRAAYTRRIAAAACTFCDLDGRLPDGGWCIHDTAPVERARQAKIHADQARQALNQARKTREAERQVEMMLTGQEA